MAGLPWCLVTSGCSANSLGVVRNLGSRGVPVALLDLDKRSPARRSRFVRQRVSLERGEGEGCWLRPLLRFARECGEKPVLISTGDAETLIFSRLASELEGAYRILLPDQAVLETVTNKRLCCRLMDEMGIVHPRSVGVEDSTELRRAVELIGFPVLVKPSFTMEFTARFRRKLFLVRSPQELLSVTRLLDGLPFEGIVQEYIPANLHHEVYTFLPNSGEVVALAGWDRLLQFPPDFGTASLCRSRLRSDAVSFVLDMLARFDFRGFAAVELVRDSRDGRWVAIDVNPRTTLQNSLGHACGEGVDWIAYRYLSGLSVERRNRFRENVLWVDDFKYGASMLMSLLSPNGGLRGLGVGLLRRKVRSVRSIRDPLPYLSALFQNASEALPWILGFAGVTGRLGLPGRRRQSCPAPGGTGPFRG